MLMSSECPHGHQALDGYLLPVNLGMGAAWNPKLVEEGFKVVGEQQKEMGVDFALVSMLDILRDPRWGRSEERCCGGEGLCERRFGGCCEALLRTGRNDRRRKRQCGAHRRARTARNSSARDEGGRESGRDGCDGSI